MGTIINKVVKVGNRNFKANIERYESAHEVWQDCKARTITDSSFYDFNHKHVSRDWEGVDSYDEALQLLQGGYQPTVDKLAEALKMNRTVATKRTTFINDIAGFAPIVPLALKGVPNSMIASYTNPIKCKVVDIYYDMTCSCSTSPETIIQNGQKVLGAIIDLEKQGYRFNLYALQTYAEGYDADILCVKVKASDKPLDLKRISFPLTHPAFFRVIGFDWYSKCPVAKYRSGYGRALAYEVSDHRNFAKQAFGDNAIYISGTEIKHKDTEHLKEVFTNAK